MARLLHAMEYSLFLPTQMRALASVNTVTRIEEIWPKVRKGRNQGVSLLKVYTFEGVSVREQLRVASHYMQVVVSIDPKDRRTGYFAGISGHQQFFAL